MGMNTLKWRPAQRWQCQSGGAAGYGRADGETVSGMTELPTFSSNKTVRLWLLVVAGVGVGVGVV